MADTSTLTKSLNTKKADATNGLESYRSSVAPVAKEHEVVAREVQDHAQAASPSSLSPESGQTPLRASPANGFPATPSALGVPTQKRFSHSTINKKFLEKASSTSTSGQTLSTSVTTKIGGSIPKPVLQTAPSHSRLVTAKLTAMPQLSATGPGWSRPPSSISSAAATSSSVTGAKAPTLPSVSLNSANSAPQLAPLGKVIQPQPRTVTELSTTSVKKEGGNKPAWSSVNALVNKLDAAASDFPTAAEVARGRVSHVSEKNEVALAVAAQKHAITAQADTFRGVHLDPNAHHWDEMEEDDDNFLDGVIEFGDGRQYNVQAMDGPQQTTPPHDASGLTVNGGDSIRPSELRPPSDQLVSKDERFGDDFDRSWPRTNTRPSSLNSQGDQYSASPPSASTQSVHSPQEARVLFNERSNRLEPYSNAHPSHRQVHGGQSSYPVRRANRPDRAISPADSRGGRDIPPHVQQQVQLLQKASGSSERRQDGYTRVDEPPGRSGAPSPETSRVSDRDTLRRGHQTQLTFSHTSSLGYTGRSHDHRNPYGSAPPPPTAEDDRFRRISTMDPVTLPSQSPRNSPRDLKRQLPPHLSELESQQSPSSRDVAIPNGARRETSHLTAEPPPSMSAPPPSSLNMPVASDTVNSSATPTVPSIPAIDLNEVHKKEMQSAAERARLRRQQEEEEREREKERARRKAAELETQLKAKEQCSALMEATPPAVSETEVVGIIEEAIRYAKPEMLTGPSPKSQSLRPSGGGGPSQRGQSRLIQGRRASSTAVDASEADSWRSRVPQRAANQAETMDAATMAALPPMPLLAEVESLHWKDGEDVEVVDFSELGKLVGSVDASRPVEPSSRPSSRLPRASASDFFEDDPPAIVPQRISEDSWRRKGTDVDSLDSPAPPTSAHKEKLRLQIVASDPLKSAGSSPAASSHTPHTHPRHVDERIHPSSGHLVTGHHGFGSQRSPLTPSYREASMSTLNDVISRIKGALDDMHTKEEPVKPQKWLPPALRLKQPSHDVGHQAGAFDVTGQEPPRSPKPAWNAYTVRIPKESLWQQAPIPGKHMQYSGRDSVRTTIYSWTPPIGGDHRRDLAADEYLFGAPVRGGSNPCYRVALPRHRQLTKAGIGPVVNLPSKPPLSTGDTRVYGHGSDIGRRRPMHAPPQWAIDVDTISASPVLDTVSRSPPPEAPSKVSSVASLPKSESTSPPRHRGRATKSQIPSHDLGGSDVAFGHDISLPDATLQKPTVSFVVSSELEGSRSPEHVRDPCVASAAKAVSFIPSNEPAVRHNKSKDTADSYPISFDDGGYGSAKATAPAQPVIVTPPPAGNGSWKPPSAYPLKDSPSRRAPDPEHLKAVWSQTSDHATIPPVNSLEGIVDDLTAVPFTLQDVKSEDGGTPPPGSGASRISSYDVSRAFQQVPSSTTKLSQGNTMLPPPIPVPPNGSVSRPTFTYSPSNIRPAYPLLSHSPSPTIMYPPHIAQSPVPRPMVANGPPSPYAQPTWMPVGGHTGQAAPNVMRPVPGPYSAPYMSYPSPSIPMYVSSPSMSNPPQQSNGFQPRTHGVPLMSPMVQPTHSLYASSPALVHSPSVSHIQSGQSFTNIPPSRGQVRGTSEHAHGGPSIPTSGPPLQAAGSYPVITTYPTRPTW